MVFTIVTIIFLPMSFIAAFFAINFEDWDGRLTIGYVSKYMFGIGLAISFVFVASAFLVHDISDAWKTAVKAGRRHAARLTLHGLRSSGGGGGGSARDRRRARRGGREEEEEDKNVPPWPSRDGGPYHHPAPGTAGGGASTTAYRSLAEDDWKRRGLDGGAGGETYARMSRDRDRDRYERAGVGMSPIRYGARRLSVGSGGGGGGGGHGGAGVAVSAWARPSFDGRRERFSGDLERGRGRDLSRSRIHWESAR